MSSRLARPRPGLLPEPAPPLPPPGAEQPRRPTGTARPLPGTAEHRGSAWTRRPPRLERQRHWHGPVHGPGIAASPGAQRPHRDIMMPAWERALETTKRRAPRHLEEPRQPAGQRGRLRPRSMAANGPPSACSQARFIPWQRPPSRQLPARYPALSGISLNQSCLVGLALALAAVPVTCDIQPLAHTRRRILAPAPGNTRARARAQTPAGAGGRGQASGGHPLLGGVEDGDEH